MKKGLAFIIGGGVSFAVSLTFYIISAVQSAYGDEYGTSLSYGNRDLLVLSLLSLCLVALGIALVREGKLGKDSPLAEPGVFSLMGSLATLYTLGRGIKLAIKGSDSALYFCLFAFAASLTALAFFNLVEKIKACRKGEQPDQGQ